MLKLHIRFGEFSLTRLKLCGEGLGLLQQLFRSHRGRDCVQHDAHNLGKLIEERNVNVAESMERCELDHSLHLPLKQHWQHDDIHRRSSSKCGSHLDVIAGNFRQYDAFLFVSSLAHERFA